MKNKNYHTGNLTSNCETFFIRNIKLKRFYCMVESISFLFHTPMSIAYLLWLISFYHSSFNVNKDFLLSVI